MATIKGWHFVANDRKLGYGDGRLVEVGKTYTVPETRDLELCEYGLHASKRLIDALIYAPGAIICRVELAAPIIHGNDKMVAYSRKVLAMIYGERLLHEFACQCAEYALTFVKDPDPRSVAAIKAKRDWLDGKITNQELSAAWDAAMAAAWAAARAAARAAAWDAARAAAWAAARAAAWDAAWDAARAAAWDAARAAAWAAAWDAARAAAWAAARAAAWAAAWDAAWDATWDAAWAAARYHLNKVLTKMVIAAIKKGGE